MIKILFTVGLVLSMTAEPQAQENLKILVYSYTPSGESAHLEPKATGKKVMDSAAKDMKWDLYHTQDPNYFTDANLAPYDVIFLLNMCCYDGVFPQTSQRAAFETAIKNGAGYVACHAVAAATAYVTKWPFLAAINGNGKYGSHGDKVKGILRIDDQTHYLTEGLGATFQVGNNEWFKFPMTFPPELKIHLLASVAKGSAGVGTTLSDDIPVSWCHYYEKSRAFYTSLGHFENLFTDPMLRQHIFRGLEWAGGRGPQTGECGEPTGLTAIGKTTVDKGNRIPEERFFSFQTTASNEIRGATLEPGFFRLELYNSQGAKVAQKSLWGARAFSLGVQEPGAYLMRAFAGKTAFTRRIVIQ
ncbi:MAG: ThuA domain-containing protein [Fibrobacteria bacterium]